MVGVNFREYLVFWNTYANLAYSTPHGLELTFSNLAGAGKTILTSDMLSPR